MVHVVIDRYFCLFLNGLKISLNTRLSSIVPLRYQMYQVNQAFKCKVNQAFDSLKQTNMM